VGGAWNPHAMSLARIWRDQGKVSERANCMLRLRAVYGGLRHARSEGGQGATGRVVMTRHLIGDRYESGS